MSFTGTKTPQLLRRDVQYVVGQGWSLIEEWRGGQSEIDGLINAYMTDGWQFTVETEPPYKKLYASRAASTPTATTDFYDRYRIRKEKVEKSIWTMDSVQTEGATYTGFAVDDEGNATQTGFGAYRFNLEKAVSGTFTPGVAQAFLNSNFPIATYPVAHDVYREISRGVEAFEDEYISLTRERVVSTAYASQLQLANENASYIYTTAQLQAVFDIPEFNGIEWPAEGSAIPNTQWGWRSRNQEVRYAGDLRVEIIQDWVWSAWSTLIYTVYGS